MTGIVMQDWKGKRLGEFGNPPGVPPMQFFFALDLYRVLYEEAARRGHPHRARQDASSGAVETAHGVTARFADGTEVRGRHPDRRRRHPLHVRALIDPSLPPPAIRGTDQLRRPFNGPGMLVTSARCR